MSKPALGLFRGRVPGQRNGRALPLARKIGKHYGQRVFAVVWPFEIARYLRRIGLPLGIARPARWP